jgi:glutamine amidotransferase
MIGIINYGMGNLQSVKNSLDFLNIPNKFVNNSSEVKDCNRIILPGVGAFGLAMERLNKAGFSVEIINFATAGKPVLGICLGMQLLMEYSEEYGHNLGLGIIKGGVFDFNSRIHNLPVPHVGWNDISIKRQSRLLQNVENGASFYFVHSFFCDLNDKDNVVATTEYGLNFDSVMESKNIFGCQFHPEKSQSSGLSILENFNKVS